MCSVDDEGVTVVSKKCVGALSRLATQKLTQKLKKSPILKCQAYTLSDDVDLKRRPAYSYRPKVPFKVKQAIMKKRSSERVRFPTFSLENRKKGKSEDQLSGMKLDR